MAIYQGFICPTGTILEIDELGSSFAAIANVLTGRLKSFLLPPIEGEATETTHGATTPLASGKVARTFDGRCLIEAGEGNAVIYFNKNIDFAQMVGKSYNFKATFPIFTGEVTAGTIWDWEAVLTKYTIANFDLLANGKAEATLTFKVSGVPVITPATTA